MPHRDRIIRGLLIACCLLAMIPVIGCSAVQHGVVVVRLREVEKSRIAETVYAGEYNLYPTDSAKPILHYYLPAGQRIGFERKEMGVIAIAGSHRDDVPDGTYVWRREK